MNEGSETFSSAYSARISSETTISSMGRSQVLYNRTKAKMRRGRDGSDSIVSELTGTTDLSGPRHLPPHQQQRPPPLRVPSYSSDPTVDPNNLHNHGNNNLIMMNNTYSESEPSVSITESMMQQHQLQVDDAVDRLLLEMPSATSAYAQSYGMGRSMSHSSRPPYRSSTSHHNAQQPQDTMFRLDTNASLASMEDHYHIQSYSSFRETLQLDLIDACLQQELSLAERLHIPQHLLDAVQPPATINDSDTVHSPSDETKSLFNENLQRALTGDERIMAARSPTPSPSRAQSRRDQQQQRFLIDTRTTGPSPSPTRTTPRSLKAAPSDENSILAEDHDALMMMEPSSSYSDERPEGAGDLILASRESSSSDEEDETTLHLLGSVTTKQPSLSTNGTSTLVGEKILDQPMMRRSLLHPLHPPTAQPMHSATNEAKPMSLTDTTPVPRSTTAIESVLKLHRKSQSPTRDTRVHDTTESSKKQQQHQPASASSKSPPRERDPAQSPASLRMRTPLQINTDRFPPSQSSDNRTAAQFVGEDMTAMSSVGLQSIRDDPRQPLPAPPSGMNQWRPKPGESFEIKTIRGRNKSPKSTPKTLTAKSPSATPVTSNKSLASNKAKGKEVESHPPSPKTKLNAEKIVQASEPSSLSPKQKNRLERIRSLSPNNNKPQQSSAQTSKAPVKKNTPPPLTINTDIQTMEKKSSKSPPRTSSPTRAQLYPIHDVSVTASKPSEASTSTTNKLPSNEQALLGSVGLGRVVASQRRGRSPVRKSDLQQGSMRNSSTKQPSSDDGGYSVTDNTSANTSAMLSSIHLLEDCDTVPGIEVSERKDAIKKSSTRGAGSYAYQGELSPAKSRASDIATYVEDDSNQGLEIKRKPSDQRFKTSQSPIRVTITTREVPKSSQVKTDGRASSPSQRQMVDVIDLSAVDSASLSPSRIIKAIRTGQPLLRDKSASPSKPRTENDGRPSNNDKMRQHRRSASPSSRATPKPSMEEWLDKNLKSGSSPQDEGIEVEDVGELNDWLDSVIAS